MWGETVDTFIKVVVADPAIEVSDVHVCPYTQDYVLYVCMPKWPAVHLKRSSDSHEKPPS